MNATCTQRLRRLLRTFAFAVSLAGLWAACPATAGTDEAAGTDEGVAVERRSQTRAERDVLLASTWHLDPELLVVQPTDSVATAVARRRLAAINERVDDVLGRYDRARATAAGAAARAETARATLAGARAVATVAAARYQDDRDLLASFIVEAYTTSSVGAVGMLFSADTDQDLVTAMMMLQEMGQSQASAVVAAARSRDRLEATAASVAVADRQAREKRATSRTALAGAEAARRQVLENVAEARTLLADSVLADQVAAAQSLILQRGASVAAAAALTGFVTGEAGDVSFPLPAGAAFVDQDNWGIRSLHWADTHTGDDLSAACGTPVLAVTDGTVMIRSDQSWSGPWLVMVATGDGGLSTWYAHMETLLVSDGQQVRAGQPIGAVGAQGNATGCHLHVEVHPVGGTIYEDDTDPSAWLHAVGAFPGEARAPDSR